MLTRDQSACRRKYMSNRLCVVRLLLQILGAAAASGKRQPADRFYANSCLLVRSELNKKRPKITVATDQHGMSLLDSSELWHLFGQPPGHRVDSSEPLLPSVYLRHTLLMPNFSCLFAGRRETAANPSTQDRKHFADAN